MSHDIPPFEVVIEATAKRAFASSVAWPGWCRSGKDETSALEALARYAPRYARVATRAGLAFPVSVALEDLVVAERGDGDASTAFGVPGRVAHLELRRVSSADARRLTDLLIACWDAFADVAAHAPAELRKGPRGGGRDRDRIVTHVEDSERGYARSIGLRLSPTASIAEIRAGMIEILGLNSDGSPLPGASWTQRYAARRIAWHVLDHAWEIEDRSEPAPG